MPKDKDLKRLTRTRMQKTGESYTAARTQLRKRSHPSPPATPGRSGAAGKVATPTSGVNENATEASPVAKRPTVDFAALAGMSDEAVRAKTGRNWTQWRQLLDAAGAFEMQHRDIARHVHVTYAIDSWWSQMVTVGYERIRGLRAIGQRRSGGYEANKSKTLDVPVDRLFDAFNNARRRKQWLTEEPIDIRRATPYKSIHMTWADGTPVEVNFAARGGSPSRAGKPRTKSQVTIQHRKLATKADAERMKKYWGERLEALARAVAAIKGSM